MEVIEDHCNTETGKRLSDIEELQTYIAPMRHVQTVRTPHPK